MVLDGVWQVVDMGSIRMDGSWHVYEIGKEGGLVKLVRPDGLRRSWSFKPFAKLSVGHNAIKFDDQDVLEELAIDEDEQIGLPQNEYCPARLVVDVLHLLGRQIAPSTPVKQLCQRHFPLHHALAPDFCGMSRQNRGYMRSVEEFDEV